MSKETHLPNKNDPYKLQPNFFAGTDLETPSNTPSAKHVEKNIFSMNKTNLEKLEYFKKQSYEGQDLGFNNLSSDINFCDKIYIGKLPLGIMLSEKELRQCVNLECDMCEKRIKVFKERKWKEGLGFGEVSFNYAKEEKLIEVCYSGYYGLYWFTIAYYCLCFVYYCLLFCLCFVYVLFILLYLLWVYITFNVFIIMNWFCFKTLNVEALGLEELIVEYAIAMLLLCFHFKSFNVLLFKFSLGLFYLIFVYLTYLAFR